MTNINTEKCVMHFAQIYARTPCDIKMDVLAIIFDVRVRLTLNFLT